MGRYCLNSFPPGISSLKEFYYWIIRPSFNLFTVSWYAQLDYMAGWSLRQKRRNRTVCEFSALGKNIAWESIYLTFDSDPFQSFLGAKCGHPPPGTCGSSRRSQGGTAGIAGVHETEHRLSWNCCSPLLRWWLLPWSTRCLTSEHNGLRPRKPRGMIRGNGSFQLQKFS